MFADYHVHSHFSEDTDFPMELEIQKAIKLGMDELCFTEHSDYDVPMSLIVIMILILKKWKNER